MKVLVVSDSHIEKLPDNTYWCRTAVHGYEFWTRYLNIFDGVIVASRVKKVQTIDKNKYNRVDGKGIEIKELPFIRGAKGYLLNFFEMKKRVSNLLGDESCAIFRMPSIPAFMYLYSFKKTKKPYAFEIIADPIDAYSENKIAKIIFTKLLKREIKFANGVSYVTEKFLQKRYPSRAHIEGNSNLFFTEHYSSIDLPISFFSKKKKFTNNEIFKIIHVASAINSDIKGHTVLLETINNLISLGKQVELTCVGDGDKRSYYEDMAKELGIEKNVVFTGLFSSKNDLREKLIDSDLFLFPSKAEGLPRAVIEAMAVGLPCISTNVNGIPELIESKYLFDPLDSDGMTKMVASLIDNADERKRMSEVNYSNALKYLNTELEIRRNNFYSKLKTLAVTKKSK